MTKKERESMKRIQAALRNPFKVVFLTEEELKRYVAIKNAIDAVAELG